MSEEASPEEEKVAILSFFTALSINRPRKDIKLTERERERERKQEST